MATSVSSTSFSSSSTTKGHAETNSKTQAQSQSQTSSESTSQKVLDEALAQRILSGLIAPMSQSELTAMAQSLLEPQMRAQMEEAQQKYDTAKLTREQEIEDMASALQESIRQQRSAYGRSMADVQLAALARGMGRSSYALQAIAGQGSALSDAVSRLTQDAERRRGQIAAQIALAADQNAATQGRIQTDYAKNLAGKIAQLQEEQRREYNQNYMTAISAAMGQKAQSSAETNSTATTTGQSTTDSTSKTKTHGSSTTVTTTGR